MDGKENNRIRYERHARGNRIRHSRRGRRGHVSGNPRYSDFRLAEKEKVAKEIEQMRLDAIEIERELALAYEEDMLMLAEIFDEDPFDPFEDDYSPWTDDSWYWDTLEYDYALLEDY